jgi:hypothetical protein
VKTTPNPKATKKSSGELGPFPPLFDALLVALAEADNVADAVEVAILAEMYGVMMMMSTGVDQRRVRGWLVWC